MANTVYNSKNVQISWSGSNAFNGFSADSFVTLSRTTAQTETEAGADGQHSISMMADKGGTCTISLQQTSPTNLGLSSIANTQDQTGILIRGDLTIADPSGSNITLLRNAHIQEMPEVTLGATANGVSKDWVFFCEEMIYTDAPEGLAIGAADSAQVASFIATVLSNAGV